VEELADGLRPGRYLDIRPHCSGVVVRDLVWCGPELIRLEHSSKLWFARTPSWYFVCVVVGAGPLELTLSACARTAICACNPPVVSRCPPLLLPSQTAEVETSQDVSTLHNAGHPRDCVCDPRGGRSVGVRPNHQGHSRK
jgi:hypothetical protein